MISSFQDSFFCDSFLLSIFSSNLYIFWYILLSSWLSLLLSEGLMTWIGEVGAHRRAGTAVGWVPDVDLVLSPLQIWSRVGGTKTSPIENRIESKWIWLDDLTGREDCLLLFFF